jgi:hypothetical protein
MRGITETTTTHCHSHTHRKGNGGSIAQRLRRIMTSEVTSCSTNKSSSGPVGRASGNMWNSEGDGGGETTGAGGRLLLYHGTYSPGYPKLMAPVSFSQAHSAWNHASWISSTWWLQGLRAFLRRARSSFWARFLL